MEDVLSQILLSRQQWAGPGPFQRLTGFIGLGRKWAVGHGDRLLGSTAVARLAGYRYSWEPGARLLKSLTDSFHGGLARVAACSKEEVC